VTRNIELEMIVNGWAWVVEQYSFEREDEYFKAQEDAQKNGRGLWQMDNPEPPWSFKRRQRRHRQSSRAQGQLL
jgi:endonuclease YncB( thermonuclease family)